MRSVSFEIVSDDRRSFDFTALKALGLRLMMRTAAQLMLWSHLYGSRRGLRSLSASELEDIGMTLSEARQEAARPFWDTKLRIRLGK